MIWLPTWQMACQKSPDQNNLTCLTLGIPYQVSIHKSGVELGKHLKRQKCLRLDICTGFTAICFEKKKKWETSKCMKTSAQLGGESCKVYSWDVNFQFKPMQQLDKSSRRQRGSQKSKLGSFLQQGDKLNHMSKAWTRVGVLHSAWAFL